MSKAVLPVRYRLRVKQRPAVVSYAEEYGVKPASRRFGLNRQTIRQGRNRWRQDGEQGLLPRYPPRRRRRRLDDRVIGLIKQAPTEHRFGAGRPKIWFERVHQVRVTARTIQRVFRDLGLPYLTKTPRRRPRQRRLSSRGDSISRSAD